MEKYKYNKTVIAKKQILSGIFLLTLLLVASMVSAQYSGVRPFAHLDSNNIFIGDKITLHIGINHQDKEQIISVAPNEPLDSTMYDIASDTKWRKERIGTYRDIAFTVWDTGLYRIPPVAFLVEFPNGEKQFFQTPSLLLTVDNPPGLETMSAPENIKNIIREPTTFSDWLPWVLAAIFLVVFGFAVWVFYKKMQEKPLFKNSLPLKKQELPHVLAERLLLNLKRKALITDEDVKNYYSELSHILREYIENSFFMPALESTTDELYRLMQRKEMNFSDLKERDAVVENLRIFLQTADLAKFAKAIPRAEEHALFLGNVFDFIQKTKPQEIASTEPKQNK
ncbi:MAG: hypothetical protein HC817_03025 [Saprospiraceae bacterium]|nr:hypothetical protein [Saprospiraceae bacterium]